jgi:protein O-mannosyl-transferase
MRNQFHPVRSSSRFLQTSTALSVCFAVIFGGLLVITLCVYKPGLSGTFLFDDYANLPSLGNYGPVDNWTTFTHYITSGAADPTGRPLTLLSFLVDANDWPADPYPFKYTSVLLHLLNGALLTWLLLRLGRALGRPQHEATMAALLGAALWLLHPLFVSTTLYVVQREAILPTTFVLIGLIGYIAARDLARRGRSPGVWLAAFSIIACTLLALLSKANGVLLPVLAWLVETLVLSPWQPITDAVTRRGFVLMRRLVLSLPSVALLIGLVSIGIHTALNGVPDIRPWTFAERLLTEARVLVEYLRLLLLPHPYTAGLFNDAFPISTGLLSPPATLACLLVIATLLAGAVAIRRRAPALALAVLFYFAGHLLESTVIPLELYYEHRNYLPALLMFWPLALWLCRRSASAPMAMAGIATTTTTDGLRILRVALAITLPLGLAAQTYLRADLWGNAQEQVLMWAEKNPASARAQTYAAEADLARGRADLAIARLEHAWPSHPDDIQIPLNLVGARCAAGVLNSADIVRAEDVLRVSRVTGQLAYDWLAEAANGAHKPPCPALDENAVMGLVDAYAANNWGGNTLAIRRNVLDLRARLALVRGDQVAALAGFNAALTLTPEPGLALNHAAYLASAGHPREALASLDQAERLLQRPRWPGLRMPSVHAWLLWHDGYWDHEIGHLRTTLESDLAEASKQTPPRPAADGVKEE